MGATDKDQLESAQTMNTVGEFADEQNLNVFKSQRIIKKKSFTEFQVQLLNCKSNTSMDPIFSLWLLNDLKRRALLWCLRSTAMYTIPGWHHTIRLRAIISKQKIKKLWETFWILSLIWDLYQMQIYFIKLTSWKTLFFSFSHQPNGITIDSLKNISNKPKI